MRCSNGARQGSLSATRAPGTACSSIDTGPRSRLRRARQPPAQTSGALPRPASTRAAVATIGSEAIVRPFEYGDSRRRVDRRRTRVPFCLPGWQNLPFERASLGLDFAGAHDSRRVIVEAGLRSTRGNDADVLVARCVGLGRLRRARSRWDAARCDAKPPLAAHTSCSFNSRPHEAGDSVTGLLV